MYRIMVVDDSMIIRNKISRLPKDSGFSIVCEAKNGQQAVELCKRYKPDIITLDITMPEMDGLEALELGAQGFLTKPFTETTLLKALNTLVSDED